MVIIRQHRQQGKQGAIVPRKHRKSTARLSSTINKTISLGPRRTSAHIDWPDPAMVAANGAPVLNNAAHYINNPASSILLDSQSLVKIWGMVTPILDEKAGKDGGLAIAGYSFEELKKDMNDLFVRIERNARRVKQLTEGL
jgi:hypothetical protein